MKNYFKENYPLLLLGLFFLVFDIMFPDLEITVSGGLAWFSVLVSWLIGFSLLKVGIFGGDVGVSSRGLVGLIKEIKNKKSTKL